MATDDGRSMIISNNNERAVIGFKVKTESFTFVLAPFSTFRRHEIMNMLVTNHTLCLKSGEPTLVLMLLVRSVRNMFFSALGTQTSYMRGYSSAGSSRILCHHHTHVATPRLLYVKSKHVYFVSLP